MARQPQQWKTCSHGMHSMTETGAISYCVGLKSFTLFNVFVILFFCENWICFGVCFDFVILLLCFCVLYRFNLIKRTTYAVCRKPIGARIRMCVAFNGFEIMQNGFQDERKAIFLLFFVWIFHVVHFALIVLVFHVFLLSIHINRIQMLLALRANKISSFLEQNPWMFSHLGFLIIMSNKLISRRYCYMNTELWKHSLTFSCKNRWQIYSNIVTMFVLIQHPMWICVFDNSSWCLKEASFYIMFQALRVFRKLFAWSNLRTEKKNGNWNLKFS